MGLPYPPVEEQVRRAVEDGLKHRCPEWTDADVAEGVLALCFGRGPDEAFELLPHDPGERESWAEGVFVANLELLRRQFGGVLPRVACIQPAYAYDGQILSISEALRRRGDIGSAHLAVGRCLGERTEQRLRDLLGVSALHVPRQELLASFSDLDLVFLPEGVSCPWIGKGPVRVGLPHTPHYSPLYSVGRHGAGAWFDVYFASRPWTDVPDDALLDVFPREMVEHGSGEFCVAAGGSPHFDQLLWQCERFPEPSRKLIYHLSLEEPWVYEALQRNVSLLLEGMPDHRLVFRPHPLERGRAEIAECVARFASHPRFQLSTSSSYVGDYADAQAAFVHTSSSVRNLPLAMLRPIVEYDPRIRPANEIPLGWHVHEFDQVFHVLRAVDERPDIARDRLLEERNRCISHPGTSVDHILDHLDDLRSRRRVVGEGWTYHPLHGSGQELSERERFAKALSKAERFTYPCHVLLEEAMRRFPDEPGFPLEHARRKIGDAEEGLLHDRWRWTGGLESAAAAWRLLRDLSDSDRESVRTWFAGTVLPHALSWAWKEARDGGNPGKALEALHVLLSADSGGEYVRAQAAAAAKIAQSVAAVDEARREAARGWAQLGAERLAAERDQPAREALEKALSLDPRNSDALFNLMLLDRLEGRDGEALQIARMLVEMMPDDGLVRKHLQELSA